MVFQFENEPVLSTVYQPTTLPVQARQDARIFAHMLCEELPKKNSRTFPNASHQWTML